MDQVLLVQDDFIMFENTKSDKEPAVIVLH